MTELKGPGRSTGPLFSETIITDGQLVGLFGATGGLSGVTGGQFGGFFHRISAPVLSCPLKGHVSDEI